MMKVRVEFTKQELSAKDRNLPLFLYRAFKGQTQEEVMDVHVDNINGYPVPFRMTNVSSQDGESLEGDMPVFDYQTLKDLLQKRYQTVMNHS